MEASYKKDATHNFLVLQPDEEVDMKAYPLRMVLGNAIPGLLPCKPQKADGKVLFYYDVTAQQRFLDAHEKLGYKELKKLCQGFLKAFEQMNMYLLDADRLILDMEYIYLDRQTEEVNLCYFPGFHKPVGEQLRHLAARLLSHIDHEDAKGVVLGYGLYRMAVEGGFQMEALGELLHRSEEEREAVQRTICKQDFEKEDSAGKSCAKEEEKEKEKPRIRLEKWEAVFLLCGLGVIGVITVLKRMGYLSGLTLPMMLAFVFGVVLTAALLLLRDKKRGLAKDLERERVLQDQIKESPETEAAAPDRSEALDCPRLVCEDSEQAPSMFLNRDLTLVGAMGEVADAWLDRPSISRIHARIWKKGREYWIADLNSRNGTFVNGKKLETQEECLLQPGDKVTFADINYRFVKTECE